MIELTRTQIYGILIVVVICALLAYWYMNKDEKFSNAGGGKMTQQKYDLMISKINDSLTVDV